MTVCPFYRSVVFTFAVVTAVAGCKATPTTPSTAAFSQTDLRVGTGSEAAKDKQLSVHYTGWLHDASKSDGKGLQFETSAGRDPFSFQLGAGQVIPGWDQGLVGMKVGGIRRLVIPPSLAYGGARNGPIPPNATLVFEIELVSMPVDPTQYTISIQTDNGSFFSVENNSNASVLANRMAAADWETFRLFDLNAGALETNDVVRIETTSGWGFVPGQNTALGALASPGQDAVEERFAIEAVSGAIGNGSLIALRSANTGLYVSADGGGGGAVTVNRSSVGVWETFRLIVR